jgi:hypothetical protein
VPGTYLGCRTSLRPQWATVARRCLGRLRPTKPDPPSASFGKKASESPAASWSSSSCHRSRGGLRVPPRTSSTGMRSPTGERCRQRSNPRHCRGSSGHPTVGHRSRAHMGQDRGGERRNVARVLRGGCTSFCCSEKRSSPSV